MVDCLQVATQTGLQMSLREWADYFRTPAAERKKLLNVITLEIGDTRLGEMVTRPQLVRDLDWVNFGI